MFMHTKKRMAVNAWYSISMKTRAQKGFTLIELLVVIAIIGLLSSVVLASLNSARKKGRDARRLSDLKQLQTALELSNDANNGYPAALSVATIVTPGYMSTLPADPLGGAYGYVQVSTTNYVIGAILENGGQVGALLNDYDGAQAITIGASSSNCSTGAGLASETVYCARQ
jgi:general secretion pathway protein G